MTYKTSPSMFFVDFDCQKDLLSFIVLSLLICSNEICLSSFRVHNFNYRKTEKQFPLCVIFTLKYFNYKTQMINLIKLQINLIKFKSKLAIK